MTNAVRAQVVVAVNSALALVVSFGVNVTDGQQAAILAGVNALLGLWVATTYHTSPYRTANGDDLNPGETNIAGKQDGS